MRINKVIRRSGPGGSAINAVIAANMGEGDAETAVSTKQDVQIVQRNGKTKVTGRSTPKPQASD